MARPRRERAADQADQEKPAKAARKAKGDDVEASALDVTELKRRIAEIARQKELAAEYSGNTGSETQKACDALGIHRKAIGFGVSLHRMEPAKRTAIVSDLIKVLDGLGYLDEGTLFSSPRKEAAAAAEQRSAPAAESPMSKAPPPPPTDEDEEQVASNVHRLQTGIKPLEEPAAGGVISGAGFAIQ